MVIRQLFVTKLVHIIVNFKFLFIEKITIKPIAELYKNLSTLETSDGWTINIVYIIIIGIYLFVVINYPYPWYRRHRHTCKLSKLKKLYLILYSLTLYFKS